jgi:hypothetical protein
MISQAFFVLCHCFVTHSVTPIVATIVAHSLFHPLTNRQRSPQFQQQRYLAGVKQLGTPTAILMPAVAAGN